jgi:ABC-type dipeptide/oligopeptide/nickel transport system permease component
MKLAVAAMLLAVTLGMGAGIVAAVYHGGWIDRAAMLLAFVGISTPVFWLGMILIAAAARAGWPYLTDDGSGRLVFLVLPAITLGASSLAVITRMTRASMLEVLDADYLRTARAKGLSPRRVVLRHALRNALIPVVTVVGLDFASYLTGAVLTESVFNYPGLGRTLIDSITDRNLPVVLCGVTLITFTFIAVNLAVDLLYAWIDPRIRLGGGRGAAA